MKRRWIIVLPLAAWLVLSCLSCTAVGWGIRGSGPVVEEKREVGDISGVVLATGGTLYLEEGEPASLRIEAQDNLLEYIETHVYNGVLHIETAWHVYLRPTRRINYYLTVADLDTIRISSCGNVRAKDLKAGRLEVGISSSGNLEMGDIEADALSVRISSSGKMKMGQLRTESLQVRISSSANLEIAGGSVKRQDIVISSSGNYRARELASAAADVRISSCGSATIRVNDELNARLTSSGNLYFAGDPGSLHARTSSSGDLKKIDD